MPRRPCAISIRRFQTTIFACIFTAGTFGSAGASEQRAYLELFVNTRDAGEILTIVRGDDVLVSASDLTAAGVHDFSGERSEVGRTSYVALSSLKSVLKYAFDERALTLKLTVRLRNLVHTTTDLDRNRPKDLRYTTDRTAFANYAFTSDARTTYDGFIETGATLGTTRFYTSGDLRSGMPFRRGFTNVTIDDRAALRRIVLGDGVVDTGPLGGTTVLGGLSVSRRADLDPYAIRYPAPGLSGSVFTPSVAEVYANGSLVRRIDLPPGTFTLQNLPIISGANATNVVIRDAFGRSQTIGTEYYGAPELLRRGLTDYTYALGFPRSSVFGSDDRYDGAALLGRYRLGVTNALTAGARLEHTGRFTSGGSDVDLRLPFGLVHLGAAASTSGTGISPAASFGISRSNRFGSEGAAIGIRSAAYTTIGDRPNDDRPYFDASIFGGRRIGRATVTLNVAHRQFRIAGGQTQSTLGVSEPIDGRTGISLLVSNSAFAATGVRQTTVYVSLTKALSGGANISAAAQGGGSTIVPTLEYQHAPPPGIGFGERARLGLGPTKSLDGTVDYHGTFGEYEFAYEAPQNGPIASDVRLAGGIAAIGKGVYFSRPLIDSFALVQAPGLSGMHVSLQNQDVGKTDAKGNLLVPGLLSNTANRLSLLDDEAPLDVGIDAVDAVVAPPPRSGALVRFKTRRIRTFVGRLRVRSANGSVVPAYGSFDLTAGTERFHSEIGQGGEFYFENLPMREASGEIRSAAGTCTFAFRVPEPTGLVTDLGELRCDAP